MTRTKSRIEEMIQTIQENMVENDRLYREGKREAKLWAVCNKDAKKGLVSLRSELREVKGQP